MVIQMILCRQEIHLILTSLVMHGQQQKQQFAAPTCAEEDLQELPGAELSLSVVQYIYTLQPFVMLTHHSALYI